MNVLLYNKITKQYRPIEYPRKDLKPILGDSEDNEYYFLERGSYPEEYNQIIHNVNSHIEFTEETLDNLPHIKKAKEFYTVTIKQPKEIANLLDRSVGNWIEAHHPVWKQVKYISRYIYLSQLISSGNTSKEIENEILFLNDLDTWANTCRLLRDKKQKDWEDLEIIPTFEWPNPPKKEDYEYN